MDIPLLVGLQTPIELSIEFWIDASTYYGYMGGIFSISDFTNSKYFLIDNFNKSVQLNNNLYTGANTVPNSRKVHIVVTHNFDSLPSAGYSQIFLNGKLSSDGIDALAYPFNMERVLLFAKSGTISTQYQYWYCPTDEVRIYNKVLRADEVSLNYNNGLGANPCTTEFLIGWYQFEQFENLDFSPLQDGSNVRIGIRDKSGNNNHAQTNLLDTNPNSETYVIKPF